MQIDGGNAIMSEEKRDIERIENVSDHDEETNTLEISGLSAPRIPQAAISQDEWQRGLLESTRAMRALDSFGGIGSAQKQILESVRAITGSGYLDRMGAWQKDMLASMRAITGASVFDGIGAWQKDFQASMEAITGFGALSGIDAIQKMLGSSPLQNVLDLHAKTWLSYPKDLTAFDSLRLQMPHLEALTMVLDGYDFRIGLQVEAFQQIRYLRPYQKRALIAHESRQKKVRLGPADLDNAEVISQGIDATQALIDGIANVEEDTDDQVFYSTLEEEVFVALEKEGTEYPIPLRGAIQTAASDNPDKARQTIASLRELMTHLLHRLSPDEEIKKWSTKPEHYVNKRPTRACRLEYIFRDCRGSSIQSYIDNEVKFTRDFFDLLNNGTHSLDTKLTENDLRYAIYKTESLILLLLKYTRG